LDSLAHHEPWRAAAVSTRTPGAIVYRRTGGADAIDAIDAYSQRLASALRDAGIAARYVPDGLSPVARAEPAPPWVLLQYNPFRYGRAGFAPRLLADAFALRRRSAARLIVMVHEAWIDMADTKSSVIGLWQRAQLRSLLALVDGVITSTERLAEELGGGAVHLPVASNITPAGESRTAARRRLGVEDRLVVATFGRNNPSRALHYVEAALTALAERDGPARLAILNLGADAPPLSTPAGARVYSPGRLDEGDLSRSLAAADVMLLPFTDGISTRRGTLMAALAHGLPVVGLRGQSTDRVLVNARDALTLAAVGDRHGFTRATLELTSDTERLRRAGEAGRRLYESQFDWPVLARRVASELSEPTRPTSAPRSPEEILFVAHDVGGTGGMERHTEQLITRLLDAGRPVTVVARTCKLEPRADLRFVRVRTPRRPFSVAYPAFFAVGSLIAARRGRALVHTTGAIVANRVDVCTVHYCHGAAYRRIGGPRASRESALYRVNSRLSAVMSLAAERWCYRPGRARVLCAVSGGVAAELVDCFPAMAGHVRTIPNGVDATRFCPDPVARGQVRAELGIDEQMPLALFVGGDWDRKGLPYAIDALAHAPGWQLAVAGPGDPAPLRARARVAGTEARLRFLGPVKDTPRLYAAGDAFLLPTAYEAFPLVALEAAASALPLLATRVNGIEDLIGDRPIGWFVARDGEDIGRRLNQLQADRELADAMAQAARDVAHGYSWQAMADAYSDLYRELTDGH
jgi:glycosyltransferase involved in cell wall biosynthesis